MAKYIYHIPIIPQSLNRFVGRENSWEYRQKKQEWKRIISLCCGKKPKKPIKRAEVELRYYFKDNRRHDPDNYAGKMVLDGLVEGGILKDDSFQCINLVLCGDVDKNNPRMEIHITDLTG